MFLKHFNMDLPSRYSLSCISIGAAETDRRLGIFWKICACRCARWQTCFHALATSYFLGKTLKLTDPTVIGLFEDEREEVDEVVRVLELKGPSWYEKRMCFCDGGCEHMDRLNAEASRLH